jgi:uncharacterized membrane protein YoaK (UPF0700 family)
MRFNEKQLEGLARLMDTLATTSVVGAVVGATGHSMLTMVEICALLLLAFILYLTAFYLRRL